MMRAVQTRSQRQLIAAERMLRRVLLVGVCGAVSCSDATGTADNAVASVMVTPPASTITVGAELPLQVVVQDAVGRTIPDAPIHWSVKDPSIASVSSSGVVTGLAIGSTQVAASAAGRSAIATITVQRVPVASVVVRPTIAAVAAGGLVQFSATVYDAGQNALTDRLVTWTSSNEAVATVNSSGMATAVAAGMATITATSEVQSDAASLTVTPVPVATVTVTPATATVLVQSSVTLSATTRDAGGNTLVGRAVAWTTNASAVATVSSSGVVTGVAPGTAIITATSEGRSGTAMVTVSATIVPVAAVTVQPSAATVVSGSMTTFTAVVTAQNGNALTDRVVTWSSSNPSVATVSSTGIVTAVATGALVGTATITASAEGRSGSATVTVTAGPVASVHITPTSTSVPAGTKVSLTAVASDAAGNPISGVSFNWGSSNSSIASVDGTGEVNAKREGTVTITATAAGITGSATVTVTK